MKRSRREETEGTEKEGIHTMSEQEEADPSQKIARAKDTDEAKLHIKEYEEELENFGSKTLYDQGKRVTTLLGYSIQAGFLARDTMLRVARELMHQEVDDDMKISDLCKLIGNELDEAK